MSTPIDAYVVPEQDRAPFLKAMAHVAAADSDPTEQRGGILDVAHRWGLAPDVIDDVERALSGEGSLEDDFGSFSDPRTPYILLQELVTLAYLDGRYLEPEKAAVRGIASRLGVSEQRVEDLEAWAQQGVEWRRRGAELLQPERQPSAPLL